MHRLRYTRGLQVALYESHSFNGNDIATNLNTRCPAIFTTKHLDIWMYSRGTDRHLLRFFLQRLYVLLNDLSGSCLSTRNFARTYSPMGSCTELHQYSRLCARHKLLLLACAQLWLSPCLLIPIFPNSLHQIYGRSANRYNGWNEQFGDLISANSVSVPTINTLAWMRSSI